VQVPAHAPYGSSGQADGLKLGSIMGFSVVVQVLRAGRDFTAGR